MELQVYSIYDQKTKVFNTPFYSSTHGEAERNLRSTVNAPQGLVSQYPEDYDLYHLGSYDDSTGTFQGLQTPQHIIKAVQLKQTSQQA